MQELRLLTTVELEHRLVNYKHYPVSYANMVHREHQRRMRLRRIKEDLKTTFKKFDDEV